MKLPVNFPINGEFAPMETGSMRAASTTIKSKT